MTPKFLFTGPLAKILKFRNETPQGRAEKISTGRGLRPAKPLPNPNSAISHRFTLNIRHHTIQYRL